MNFGIYSHIVYSLIFTGFADVCIWALGFPILRPYFWKILLASLVLGIFYGVLADHVAVSWGLWSYSSNKILGLWVWGVPVDDLIWAVLVGFTMGSFIILYSDYEDHKLSFRRWLKQHLSKENSKR